nr:hypothetical protein [Mycobacterium lepraemurium]
MAKFAVTVEKLELSALTADSDRSMAYGMVNWAKRPRIRPGRKHSAEAIEVRMPTSSAARNTMPKLRGLKNDPMVTGRPSARSRQPDR